MRFWIATLLLLLAGLSPAEVGPVPMSSFSIHHRTVFYAVLEGLYEDGVADADVDRILMLDGSTKAPMHFVYGCPLCSPALDAFRATARSRFASSLTEG